MSEKMNELFMMGLGALALTREKAQKIADELVKKGKIESEEASAVVEEIAEKGKKTKTELSNLIKSELKKSVENLNLATGDDIDRLEKNIEELGKKIEELEKSR